MVEGSEEAGPRLLTPVAGEDEYGDPYPIDTLHDTPDDAMSEVEGWGDDSVVEAAARERWVLCLVEFTPVPLPRPWNTTPDEG